MADSENLVMEHLRAIRRDLADMREENRETRLRVAHLEEQSVALFGQVASVSSRLDRLHDSVQRVGQRLELVD